MRLCIAAQPTPSTDMAVHEAAIAGPQRGGAPTAPQRGEAKTARIPIRVEAAVALPKPDWIRVRLSQAENFHTVKRVLREARLHTVCEEASCPNIGECFGKGTAT